MLFRSGYSKSASVSHRQTRTTALGNIPYFHKVPFTLLGCSQLPGPRTVLVRSAPGSARMPGKPRCRGMVGATANRDGSRSDPELDATVFTVLMAGRADDRSALVRACPSRMTDNTTIAALHQEKMRLLGNGGRILIPPPIKQMARVRPSENCGERRPTRTGDSDRAGSRIVPVV